MKNLRRSIISLSTISALAIGIYGEAQAAGTSSAQFLKMGAGARAAAMGDAFGAVSDDVSATYWNPAGLPQVKTPEFGLMQTNGLVDTHYQFAGAALPFGRNALGLSFYRQDNGSIDGYTASNVKNGSFNAESLAASVSFGSAITENLSLGGSGKFIQEAIDSEKGASFAGDFGVLFRQNNVSFAATLQNMGPGIAMVKERFALPQTIRLASSVRFLENKILASLDLSKPNDNEAAVHAGVEYSVAPHFTLRGGYSITPGNKLDVTGLTGVTGGFGASFGNVSLDYAFIPFGQLGDTHRLSLQFHFQNPQE